MRAWRVHELGEPATALVLGDVPLPEPGAQQVRVRVAAAALNFSDDLLCRGRYQLRPPLPFTPGMEVSGVVDAAGSGVSREIARPGARVMARTRLPSGGLAEYALADEQGLFRVSEAMSDAEAAGLIIPYHTTHVALHRRARLEAGETLLVHAGAGGLGSAAIQLGVAAGARVFATAGGAAKVKLCRELGAEIAIDYRDQDFAGIVKEATAGEGVDVVYDSVGGDTFDRSRRCLAWEGRLLVVGFSSGRIPEAPANHVMLKSYSVVGVYLARYGERAPALLDEVHEDLLRLHAEGHVAPLIHREIPLEEAASALADLADRRTVGKVVVAVDRQSSS